VDPFVCQARILDSVAGISNVLLDAPGLGAEELRSGIPTSIQSSTNDRGDDLAGHSTREPEPAFDFLDKAAGGETKERTVQLIVRR